PWRLTLPWPGRPPGWQRRARSSWIVNTPVAWFSAYTWKLPGAQGRQATARRGYGDGSVEGGLAVPGPLELEEAVRLGHQRHPVEEPPGRLAPGNRGDDRAEDGVAADTDDRCPDVQPDGVEGLVVRGPDLLVELGAHRGLGQRRGQPHLGEGLGDHLGILPAPLVVQAGADGGVQRAPGAGGAMLCGRRADPHPRPRPGHPPPGILPQPPPPPLVHGPARH